MIIKLSGAHGSSSIWSHEFDFRPILHDTHPVELYYIHFEIAQFERPANRILVSMYILVILGADLKKSETGNVFTYPDFCPCAKKIMRFRATRRYLALKWCYVGHIRVRADFLGANRGVRSPNLQVVITHVRHVCDQQFSSRLYCYVEWMNECAESNLIIWRALHHLSLYHS